jgi:outer membrane protein OmpA-like peptidoglycan-associated protein
MELNTPVSFPSAEQTVVLENKTQTSTSNFSTTPLNYDMGTSVIFYDFNTYELKKTTIYELARISKILNEFPSMQIEITGHTDNIGSDIYNQQLSQKRTDAILLYFKYQSNINEKRIIVKNYGETMPIASNKTEKGRELNRRVEISFKTKLLVNN